MVKCGAVIERWPRRPYPAQAFMRHEGSNASRLVFSSSGVPSPRKALYVCASNGLSALWAAHVFSGVLARWGGDCTMVTGPFDVTLYAVEHFRPWLFRAGNL